MQINSQIQHLAGLNDQQREAVLCRHDIVYVSAGPGTGKTHMLTSKLVDFIVSSDKPQKIVALSYTNTAARQLGERFEKKIRQCGITAEYSFFNGTIHSFCYRMMKQFGESSFDYVILDEEEITELAQEIGEHYDGKYPIGQILSCLRYPKKGDALSDEITSLKEAYKVISIQDILTRFIRMMDESAAFRLWIQDKVSVMAIDEAQDLSDLNYAILDRLIDAIPRLKVFLVGDPRQNIFGFLGGSYKYLDEFLSKYKEELSQKDLTLSYRCPQKILDFTNGLSFSDCRNPQLKSNVKQEGTIEVKSYGDEYAEAEAIVEFIKTLPDPNGIAVLFPRLRPLAKIVDKLNEEHIAFRVLGGGRIIKPHIAVFSYMCKIVETDGRSLGAANNLCGRLEMPKCRTMKEFFATGIGREIARLNKAYQSKNISYLELARSFVILCRRYIQDGDKTEQNADFKKLYDAVIKKTDSPKGYARSFKYYRNAFSSLEVEFKSEAESKDAITISTIHSAKGLEWDTVIIPELTESGFKNGRANEEVSPEEREEAANTDLKLLYVAVTRAKDRLLMTYPNYLADSRAETKPLRMIRSIILSV